MPRRRKRRRRAQVPGDSGAEVADDSAAEDDSSGRSSPSASPASSSKNFSLDAFDLAWAARADTEELFGRVDVQVTRRPASQQSHSAMSRLSARRCPPASPPLGFSRSAPPQAPLPAPSPALRPPSPGPPLRAPCLPPLRPLPRPPFRGLPACLPPLGLRSARLFCARGFLHGFVPAPPVFPFAQIVKNETLPVGKALGAARRMLMRGSGQADNIRGCPHRGRWPQQGECCCAGRPQHRGQVR